MPTDSERMILELSADLRTFQKAMITAAGSADKAAQRVERRFEQMNRKAVQDFRRFQQQVTGVLAAIGIGFVVRDVTQLADVWTTVGNRLAFAGVQSERLATVQQVIADIASRTRSDLDSTADLFARMYRSSEDLGASLAEVARVTEVVSKALAGASQSERAGAIRQLGQGLGSGRLQGDELRSILENSRPIAQAIADEFETTVGNLRELGKQGQLESRRVFEAILNAGDDIDAAFARTSFTVADSFVRLRTEAARFIGTNEQTSASVRSLTRLIDFVANNFELLADAVVVTATVLGGAFAGTAVARALGALSQLTIGANTARAALAFFGGPLGIALTLAGASLAYVATQTDLLTSSTQALARANDSAYSALQKITSFVDDLETLAETAGQAADDTSGIAAAADDAATALDDMRRSSEGAQEALGTQGTISIALAEAERARTIATLQQAIADQEAAVAATRRQAALRGLTALLSRNPVQPNPVIASQINADEQAAIERSERLVEIFENAVAAGERLDISTWQRIFDLRSEGGRADEAAANANRTTREELERSAELTLARLRHNEAIVRQLEDAEAITKRTAAYEGAGLSAAAARVQAEAEVRLEREAMNAEAERSYQISLLQDRADLARLHNQTNLLEQLQDEIELRRRSRELVDNLALSEEEALRRAQEYIATLREARDIEREHALDMRHLEEQAEAARLRGDDRAEQTIRRRLELESRISELRRIGLSEESATERAQGEVQALDRADIQGKFRAWFTGGVTASLEGDLDDFVADWWRERVSEGTQRALDELADALFDVFEPILGSVIEAGTEGIGQAVADALGGGSLRGLGALSEEAIAAGEALKTGVAAAAADAAAKLALTGAASAASAAKEAAAGAAKAVSTAQLVSAEAILAKAALQAAHALQTLASSSGNSGTANILSTIASAFAGGGGSSFPFGGSFDQGGTINPGKAFLVHRDEVIIPKQPSVVIPKGSVGGGGFQYVDARRISFVGTQSEINEFRQVLAEDLASRELQFRQFADQSIDRRTAFR